MEKTISGELQHNVLAMFISEDNPGPFIMIFFFLLMLIYYDSHFIDFRSSWQDRFCDRVRTNRQALDVLLHF